jgi:hypothetical protein
MPLWWYAALVERRDLYEDDLTEERLASPVERDIVAGTQTLDPDVSQDDGPGPLPRATVEPDDDEDDFDDEDDEDEEEDDDEDLDD